VTPGKLAVSYRTTGGTESVEGALQIAMAYTSRRKSLSIEDSYHGNSLGTLSIGASQNRETFKSLLPRCKGFAVGIEVEDEDYAAEIGDACRKNGLLVSAEEDVLMLFPALNITRATAQLQGIS